jgi:AraC-like DNA-binding protein
VKPGTVFLLNPGQVHCWKLSEDAEGYVFFHSSEFYNGIFISRNVEDFPFFYLRQNYPVIYLEDEPLRRVEYLFKEINREYAEDALYRNSRLGSLVDLAYIEIAREYSENSTGAQSGTNYIRVKQLQKLIDLNFKSKKNASDYADLMNMSIRHLSRICKETINKATSDLIIERILVEAKRLLINQDVTVSIVANELGYEDASYFTRFFKQHTGLGPKEFQQKSRFFNIDSPKG